MSLKLKKFDMKNLGYDKVIVMIGKRNTGKSFLVKDLLYYKRDIPIGTVISGTEGANSFYSKIVPSLFIHDEYSPEIIEKVCKRQKLVIKKIAQDKATKGKTNIDPRAFLLLDDCLYDKSWIKDKNIRSLFMNGRHYSMMFLITMQYSLGVPPSLRTNIDYVFILRENYHSNRKRLYEHYAGMFPSFDVFNQVMDQCTENFECIVIDNTSKSNRLEDQVFWYKASEHENFQIGNKQFWKYHSKNFNQHYDSDSEDDFKIVKKKKTNVVVNKLKYF